MEDVCRFNQTVHPYSVTFFSYSEEISLNDAALPVMVNFLLIEPECEG